MNTIVNERKMDFVDFISEGFNIFFARIRDFSLLALAIIIPINFLLILISDESLFKDTSKIILFFLILGFQTIAGLISMMSSKIIVESVVKNEPTSLTKAISLATEKWGRAFITQLLTSLIIFGLSLLLLIPGFIYSIYYLFTFDAVALRDKDGMEALKYSKMLIEGQWWRIFWISIGIGIVFNIFNVVITFLLGKVSENPYFVIIPNTIIFYIASIFGVISTVLFLNTDFVYHRKLKRNKEIKTKKNHAPSIEKYLQKKKKVTTSKRTTVKKVKTKAKKSKNIVMRNIRKKT